MGLLAGAALTAACAAGPEPRMLTPATADDLFVAGYHPYWALDSWAEYPVAILDELYFFELEAGADGTFSDPHGWPSRWVAMRDAALQEGVQVVPTVSLHGAEAFEALFTDADGVGRLVSAAVGLLDADPKLAGIHLDVEVFEPVSTAARDGFTAFVARLASRMRMDAPTRSLSVFALAFDDDDAYNEGALGQIADFLVVQGYDYHSAGSPSAGPLGALEGWGRLNWPTVVERFEALGVPRSKLVMSAPLYGYEWPVDGETPGSASRGTGVAVPYRARADVLPELPRVTDRVAEHGSRRDAESGQPYYAYEGPEGWVQGWYDDGVSLAAKIAFVRREGLGGIAFFPMPYGDEDLWAEVRRALGR